MSAKLIQGDGVLLVKLGGTKEEFAAQLARVKSMAGKRYNPHHPEHGKVWEVPDDDAALLKLVSTVEPDMPAGLLARVRSARQEQATELVTRLPDDAELLVPWATRMAPKQRAGVEFMLETAGAHALLADDMGGGKTLQAITTIYEYLLRSLNHEDVLQMQEGEAGDGVPPGSSDEGWESPAMQKLCTETQSALRKIAEGLSDTSEGNESETTPGGEGTSVRGLRDTASAGLHGPGPCSGDEAKRAAWDWIVATEQGQIGDCKVPGALSELSSLAALPRLVLAPAAVLQHWKNELVKWAGVDPERVTILDEKTPAKREEQLAAAVAQPGAWVLVNYEKLQRRVKLIGDAKKKGPLDKIKWLAVIADESHRCKNHDSQTARGLFRLKAPVQIAASGTPVLNNPGELYSTLHWLNPTQYTSFWAFYHSYTELYKGYQGRDVIIGVKNADGLRFELSGVMVRRTKRQIHPEIPEPLDPIVYEPAMSPKQAKIYAEAEKDFWFEIAQAPDISADQKKAMAEALGEDKLSVETIKMMIPNAAARTMRLRQVATSPALLGGEDVSSKLDEAEQIVLSNGLDQPFVWFAWFKDTVDILVSRFQALGVDARGFHGGNTGRPERAKLAAEFQAGEFPIIAATIKTGGTGIDLFRAQNCGFIEEDWVPGENQQAFDRVDRKGQTDHPQRHILRVPDSVDVGKIAPKLATKTFIVETLMGAV